MGLIQPSLVVLLDRDAPIERDEDMDGWRRIRAEYLTLASKEKTASRRSRKNAGTLEQTPLA